MFNVSYGCLFIRFWAFWSQKEDEKAGKFKDKVDFLKNESRTTFTD
jgi:hypothetical protein